MTSEKRPRGRPVKDTYGDLMHGTLSLVYDVFAEQVKLGGGRGTEAEAIRRVASARCWDEASLKRAVQRAKKSPHDMPKVAGGAVKIKRIFDECARRTRDIPEHVKLRAGSLPMGGFLKLLREHEIDGNCPKWLMSALLEDHTEEGRALLAVIASAAPKR